MIQSSLSNLQLCAILLDMQFLVPFEELLVRAGRELRVDLLTELIVHQRNIRFKFTIGYFSFTSVVFSLFSFRWLYVTSA